MHDPGTEQLVVVSNRLPVRRADSDWELSSGGLVAALEPVLRDRRGTWVGWAGEPGDSPSPTRTPSAETRPTQTASTDRPVRYGRTTVAVDAIASFLWTNFWSDLPDNDERDRHNQYQFRHADAEHRLLLARSLKPRVRKSKTPGRRAVLRYRYCQKLSTTNTRTRFFRACPISCELIAHLKTDPAAKPQFSNLATQPVHQDHTI